MSKTSIFSGKAIIFSAPSGAGKTTIVKHIINQIPELSFSISACSRNKRKNEINGVDYYFLDVNEFKNKIKADEFIEWEEVYANNFYGTLKSEITKIWSHNKHVIFDVDVVGGISLKKYFSESALSIFIEPPSIDILEQRLKSRNTDSLEAIKTRVDKAKEELEYKKSFDQCLINDDLNTTLFAAENIIKEFLLK